jgi:hypothetical protein
VRLGANHVLADAVQLETSPLKSEFKRRFAVAKDPVFVYGL